VTAWAGLTVIVVLRFFQIGFKHKSNFVHEILLYKHRKLLFRKVTFVYKA